MFLKAKELTALVRDAYKYEALWISNFKSDIVIHTGRFAAQIDKRKVPRKTLAKIYELCGEMPGENEKKAYAKDMENIEQADDLDEWEKIFDVKGRTERYEITKLVLDGMAATKRIAVDEMGAKHAYSEECIQAVKKTDSIYGPYAKPENSKFIIWYDDDCIFMVCEASDDTVAELMRDMNTVSLPYAEEFSGM